MKSKYDAYLAIVGQFVIILHIPNGRNNMHFNASKEKNITCSVSLFVTFYKKQRKCGNN